MYREKCLLITGGTGSFGNAVLRRFLGSDLSEIRIFSRDEKKQNDMRKFYRDDRLKFVIGDVRDVQSVNDAVKGADYIFHAAALKQVPSCEFYPLEATKTNVVGTENVLNAAIVLGVSNVVVLSTDKAVYPINAMGITKALMEKVAIAKSRVAQSTTINITRYGNVMSSRGSVIPLFVDQIRQGVPITITDPSMTRFLMSLDDALDLVLYAFQNGKPGEVFVKKAPATNLDTLSRALISLVGKPDYPMRTIGTRHGEKLFESLLSREEMAVAKDLGDYFCISPDQRDLNYEKYIEQGEVKISHTVDYNSHNAAQLDLNGVQELLKSLRFMRAYLRGETFDIEE